MAVVGLRGRVRCVRCEYIWSMVYDYEYAQLMMNEILSLLSYATGTFVPCRENLSQHLACDACGTPRGGESYVERS